MAWYRTNVLVCGTRNDDTMIAVIDVTMCRRWYVELNLYGTGMATVIDHEQWYRDWDMPLHLQWWVNRFDCY